MEGTPETPIVLLAKFIAGTINEGCDCEECAERKQMVTTLIYNRHSLDELVLHEAVKGTIA